MEETKQFTDLPPRWIPHQIFSKEEFVDLIHQWVKENVTSGPPNGTIIHYDDGNPFAKGWVISNCDEFGIFVHEFCNWDNCGSMHDHPYDSMSLCLEGPMTEKYAIGDGPVKERIIQRGDLVFRPSNYRHVLPYKEGEKGLTLFITGPVFRHAYFYCPEGKIEYSKFVEFGNKCFSTFVISRMLGLFGSGTTSGPTSPNNLLEDTIILVKKIFSKHWS